MDKILKIFQCTNLGGMEKVAYGLLDELRDTFQFKIISPRPFGAGKREILKHDANALDFEYKGKFGWRSYNPFKAKVNELSQNCSAAWVTGTCATSLRAIKGLDINLGLSHHYHHFENKLSPIRWRLFYSLLCHQLDFVTYPTDYTRNEAVTICPWLKPISHVVHNGYQKKYLSEEDRNLKQMSARQMLKIPSESFVIGNAGWMVPRKRPDVFLDVALKIAEIIPNSYFVYCGGGPLEQSIRSRIESAGLEGRFLLPGWVNNIDLYYQAWDICLFNSDFDTIPCTPIEAASHGCNIVASLKQGGLFEFFKHGKNACMLNSHDRAEMVKQIVSLANTHLLRTEHRGFSNELFSNEYSLANSVATYKSLLRSA